MQDKRLLNVYSYIIVNHSVSSVLQCHSNLQNSMRYYKKMKNIYKIRSKIAHGESLKQIDDLNIYDLEDYLRMLVNKYMKLRNVRNTSHNSIAYATITTENFHFLCLYLLFLLICINIPKLFSPRLFFWGYIKALLF